MNPLIHFKKSTPLFAIVLMLACVAFPQRAQARLPPPLPDGGYPGNNTAEGDNALFNLTTGFDNTAMGFGALFSNTTGNFNTANGAQSLLSNTIGSENTANGVHALFNNTIGALNTATGSFALYGNTSGGYNTATGVQALYLNRIGDFNTATGVSALEINRTGSYNTANGFEALFLNNGNKNTADGSFALVNNTSGNQNTANGFEALFLNTIGHSNTAIGVNALFSNTTASNNTATGFNALSSNTTGSFNTAEGFGALFRNTTGDNNIALGNSAGSNLTTGSDNIDIGAPGAPGEADTIRIGRRDTHNRTFIAGISGVAVTGSQVVVNSSAQLGVTASSARFKEAIKPMDKASETILGLKPVTFHYKKELDTECTPQFGLVAEEVEKVNPDLVARDAQGKVYTVRYDAVNAMLLNEFLKEHRKVKEQECRIQEQAATISQLKKDLQTTAAHQQKQIEALTAGLQKVSSQLEVSKPAPQTALNNH